MSAAVMISRAEHALRTNQPSLATLYMKRAAELLKVERAQIRADWYKARTDKLNVAFEMIGDAFRPLTEALSAAAGSFIKFSEAFAAPTRQQLGSVS